MSASLQRWLLARWRQSPPSLSMADALLLPLSGLYKSAIGLRRWLYRKQYVSSTRLPVPVVVVGNVIVGGAGKTPITMALVQALQQRGIAVGVIARGYGRVTQDCREVRSNSTARDVGDEPLLIQQRCQVPVFVARRRAEAGHALLHAYPGTQVIVCDDGLQHLQLQRDVELCVFPSWGIGNGRLLPAGPLREPWPRSVDAVLQNQSDAIDEQKPVSTLHHNMPHWPVTRQLAINNWRNAKGARIDLAHIKTEAANGLMVTAVAGIALPEAFFKMLSALGIPLAQTIALPDHYDFAQLPDALQKLPADAIVLCTEKDAVKLWPLLPDAWAVPLETKLPQATIDLVMTRIAESAGHNTPWQ